MDLPGGAGPDWGDGRVLWRTSQGSGLLDAPGARSWRTLRWGVGEMATALTLGLPAEVAKLDATLSWAASWRGTGQPQQFSMRLPQVLEQGADPGAVTSVILTSHKPPEAPGDSRWYRTAAEHAAVQGRLEACLAKGDPKKCSYVGESERGFLLTSNAVQWDGRAWMYRPAPGMPLRAEIKGEVSARLPWQPWLPNPVVPDLPSPEEERLWLSVGWQAPLAQTVPVPIRQDAPAGNKNTLRQTVRIPLPDGIGDAFEIKLPGKVLPRPLRFERHRLDGGVMPFNC